MDRSDSSLLARYRGDPIVSPDIRESSIETREATTRRGACSLDTRYTPPSSLDLAPGGHVLAPPFELQMRTMQPVLSLEKCVLL